MTPFHRCISPTTLSFRRCSSRDEERRSLVAPVVAVERIFVRGDRRRRGRTRVRVEGARIRIRIVVVVFVVRGRRRRSGTPRSLSGRKTGMVGCRTGLNEPSPSGVPLSLAPGTFPNPHSFRSLDPALNADAAIATGLGKSNVRPLLLSLLRTTLLPIILPLSHDDLVWIHPETADTHTPLVLPLRPPRNSRSTHAL